MLIEIYSFLAIYIVLYCIKQIMQVTFMYSMLSYSSIVQHASTHAALIQTFA